MSDQNADHRDRTGGSADGGSGADGEISDGGEADHGDNGGDVEEDGRERVWEEGVRLLRSDPGFGPLVEAVGPVRLPPAQGDAFASLLGAIVYQQLAGQAASTIHGRVVEALGGEVRPEALLGAPDERLRGAGLSRNKLRAARDLARRFVSGDLVPETFAELSDDAVVEKLTRVWGIGRWTARMFLLGELRRPDVWPVGDLGVRRGWARVHGLDEAPDAEALDPMGDPYRPWRSAVAWYCWRAVDVRAPGVEEDEEESERED